MRHPRGEQGYVLLDALIALSIVAAGFAVGLGGIAMASRAAARQDAAVVRAIEERNAEAMAPAAFVRGK